MYISVCVKKFTDREDIILTHATNALYATQGVCFTPQIHTKFDGSNSNSERHRKCNNIMQTILSTSKCYYDKKDVEVSCWLDHLINYQSI